MFNQREYNKKYYQENKEQAKEYNKKYYQENKEQAKEYKKKHYQENKEQAKEYKKKHYQENKEHFKKYREDNKEYHKKWSREHCKKKYHEDIEFRIILTLRSRLSLAIKNNKKSAPTKELLGADIKFVRNWIEGQFVEGMNWDNYGKWHIDHVYPISKFNLMQPYEQKICFHWFNLQPMWAEENLKKSDSVF